MTQLNLEPRIQRLERRLRLLNQVAADDQSLRRLEVAPLRMARYDPQNPPKVQQKERQYDVHTASP